MQLKQLELQVSQIMKEMVSDNEKLDAICELLQSKVPYYNWVGFYFVNGDRKELKLTNFVGKPTEHTLIPFGKGICGQVAVSNKNFVVQDVTEQDNYISCGFDVKSEVVIPIFKNGKNIGQIDIDSHHTAPFSEEDERFLEFVCTQVSQLDLAHLI
ncbi:GAF domain-containing protein [Namhaeicola litoreus]|uniref:GAF domain-containing protein n=1 Tax=Namhaeicola litoreus TaxID=1052145 RepID=A0ABW3Y0V9_9FLAO